MKIKTILYFLFCLTSLLLCAYLLFSNYQEVYERSLGHNTIFAQMSLLTDKQAMFYSIIWGTLFLILLAYLTTMFYKKKQKAALIISTAVWVAFLLMIYVDSLTYTRI